jgi:hypothetical protein
VSTALPIAAVAALALAGTLSRRGARNEPSMPSMAKPFAELPADKRTDVRGAVLYEGPSRIDKEPIIVIMTYTSSNEKTGDIPQVWLLPHGVHPHQARVEGHDTRVCGGCIFAGNRGCYLNWFELKSIQDSYTRGNYSDWDHAAWWMRRNAPSVIRIGAYGDPAAAPLEVWERLAAMPSGKPGPSGQTSTATLIGYTQLWRSPLARGLERFCMASTKSPTEYADAKRRGWRSFRVALPEDAACAQAQVRCPATDSDEDTCKGCKLCSGGASGPDVMEPIHGNPRVAGKAMTQMRKLKEREAKGSLARQRGACGRCDGRGKIGAFAHYAGGVCFACGGTGELELDPEVKPATSAAKDYKEVDVDGLGRAFIVRDGAGFTADVDHGKIWFRVVDGRVVVDAVSDGLRARRVTVRKVQEALQSVLRVRGSAAFGEAEEGVRYKVWHQTSPAAAAAIRRQGFRLDIPRARKSDDEMPDGVFLKFSDSKIGLAGDEAEQILVQARVRSPLRVQDREQLKSILMRDERYARLSGEHEQMDREYKQRVDASEEESDQIYRQVYAQLMASGGVPGRIRRVDDPRLEAAMDRSQAIIEEWSERVDALSAKMRQVSTDILISSGHDALIMEEDRGSFGRKVKTLVVLDPKNVRPVSGSLARVLPAVTQADLDAIRGWWGRGKGAAEDAALQQRIRDLSKRFDAVPPKVLYRGLSVPPGTIGPHTSEQAIAALASGFRSWSKDKRMASAYAKRDLYRNADEVVLVWTGPAKEALVLDAGQLDAAARRALGVESSLDTSEVIAEPSGLTVESVKRKVLGSSRSRFEVFLI